MDSNKKRNTITSRGELVNEKDPKDMAENPHNAAQNPMKTAPNKYSSKGIMNNPTPD